MKASRKPYTLRRRIPEPKGWQQRTGEHAARIMATNGEGRIKLSQLVALRLGDRQRVFEAMKKLCDETKPIGVQLHRDAMEYFDNQRVDVSDRVT